VYVRSLPSKTGRIRVEARHSSLGSGSVEITVA